LGRGPRRDVRAEPELAAALFDDRFREVRVLAASDDHRGATRQPEERGDLGESEEVRLEVVEAERAIHRARGNRTDAVVNRAERIALAAPPVAVVTRRSR
jgi:hypothetical protein